ncbi:MAG: TIGR01777 family protein [Actinobacteria bacterium]|nr:TIGR01777 family protein [Actinomycetota bacterium]
MNVVVTGASGLIGTALCDDLRHRGDTVIRLKRSEDAPGESLWHPTEGMIDDAVIEAADAVVHLAGAGIGDKRWSAERRAAIRRSRVDSTRLIASSICRAKNPPLLVSGSAVGFYGDRGDETHSESSPPGGDHEFLVQVTTEWENATAMAQECDAPVAHLRTGIVMADSGGALGKMLPPFRFGLGGKLGQGTQWFPWVSIRDEVRAILFIIENRLTGPFNVVSPGIVRQMEFAKTLGKVLRRPAVIPLPRFAGRVLLGRDMADSLLFISQRIEPARLSEAGFVFHDEELETALRDILNR